MEFRRSQAAARTPSLRTLSFKRKKDPFSSHLLRHLELPAIIAL